MAQNVEQIKRELIDSVADRLRERLPEDKQATAIPFARLFFTNAPPKDFVDRDIDALYGAVMNIFGFAAQRRPGEDKVRIYNPRVEEHGWQSDHTVIEIVTDNMPFLVDSISAAMNAMEAVLHLLVHPVAVVERDAEGRRLAVAEGAEYYPTAGGTLIEESIIYMEVSEETDPETLEEAAQELRKVLADVRAAVEDWRKMREKAQDIGGDLAEDVARAVADDLSAEARDFLFWLAEDHFTFLGYREYRFDFGAEHTAVAIDPESGLGILRDPAETVFDELRRLDSLPEEVAASVRLPIPLMVTKANKRSTVHRPVHLDAVGLKMFDQAGEVVGLRLFVGLFTADVYTNSPLQVPVLERKLIRVVRAAGFRPDSHDGRRLMHILESLPRDELFQIDGDALLKLAIGILHLQERQRVALFLREDDFKRFVSVLVFIPRDRFDTQLRRRIQAILEETLGGEIIAFYTQLADSPLARLQFILRTDPTERPDYDTDEIERQLAHLARSWGDHLHDALIRAKGEEAGLRLFRRYGDAFPSNYEETFLAESAVVDIERIEEVLETGALGMNLYRPIEASETRVRFKIYHADEAVPLSNILPMMENMGFKVLGEVPFLIQVRDRSRGGAASTRTVWIHDFEVELAGGGPIALHDIRDDFQNAFARVWCGAVENDGFNRLVILAGLTWREVVVLRAYAKYLRQVSFTFAQTTLEATLAAYPGLTRALVDLFSAWFDPAHAPKTAAKLGETLLKSIALALDEVTSADDDRILRRFLDLVQNTLRTNYFRTGEDGNPRPYLSFKLDSRKLDDLPLPRPWREIWVYSPAVEGIHLRGGKVARGGLRWSDRREDFRTEILGLMKAQMVKNAVIVPVGSKGGFVVKRPPPAEAGREAWLTEGIACYKTFIRGLLDLTDNIAGPDIVPPPDVVRRDEDDPYLVVAADKGTASFSDIANGISLDYGFWLGDAFASGGTHGYDHKKMGITARGAWESVKRHFREMGLDTQKERHTVVGIGDMSGDVFGNGLLQSEHSAMVAAFNHLHIFVDPNPKTLKKAFEERRRLFDLPRSTWKDYDAELISKGGGVFDRKAKAVPVSPEMKERFGITTDHIPPNELIKAILRAEVDLIWFGGIGTYIKSSEQTNADADDRANDGVRINAKELRAKVIGEGANLAVTQLGRIEAALKGVRLNTDAIDNSAGVDCSDHEVNIKILLNGIVADGDLTEKQRNQILEKMTDEVGHLVLRDNYLQTQAISLVEAQAMEVLDHQDRFMRMLEKQDRLDRAIEFLPDDEVIAERAMTKTGLTRPEIAVLMPYAKIWLYDVLLASGLPDEPILAEDLSRYFPAPVRKKYAKQIKTHRLKREIIATHVTNSMINRVGGTFVTQMMERTGMDPATIARAYLISRDAFGLRAVWHAIEQQDAKIPSAAQIAMLIEVNRLIDRATLWLLRNGPHPLDIGGMTASLGRGVEVLNDKLRDLVCDEAQCILEERAKEFLDQGAPDELAQRIAGLIILASAFDIVRISQSRTLAEETVARIYFRIGERFGLGWLRAAAEREATGSHWQKMAVGAVIEELYTHQRELTDAVLEYGQEKADAEGGFLPDPAMIDDWSNGHRQVVDRADQLVSELRSAGEVDLAMLTVASRQFRALTHG